MSHDPSKGSFHGWLLSVVQNGLNHQDRMAHAPGQFDDDTEFRLPSREPNPAVVSEACDERALLRSAIEQLRSKLTEKTYRIVEARLVEGREYDEIAAQVGLTVKRVRDRYSRAIIFLRAKLKRPP